MKTNTLARRIPFVLLLFAIAVTASAQQQPREITIALNHRLNPVPAGYESLEPVQLDDTVDVLAVMVEFPQDDDSRTSGNGTFGSIYPTDYGAEILDPLPHNKAYFENHLRFLRNYVRKSSGGQTVLRTHIMENIVTVPSQIRDYSPARDQDNQPIAQLAVDAWQGADAAHPGFDFAAYDMFVVFHASRGRDIDITSIQGSNPTPFDIPSLSFRLPTFKSLLGDEFDGIQVSGGAFRITNTSIIPTTNNYEIDLITGQRALLELTINGLLAASFGTFAGLPDLFDTNTGKTGIGRFGLMDAESIFAFGGISPPAPSAWEKIQLGWAVPKMASSGSQEYQLFAQRSDGISRPDILKVPITGEEYWLLENRQRDPLGNGQVVTIISSGNEITRTFPKDTTGFSNSDVSALQGVIVDVEDLDWSLPGGSVQVDDQTLLNVNGGVLIWHIDEDIIAENLDANAVNNNPELRGVDLEQAAGPQDIGVTISTIFGDQTPSGTPLDYWFEGNISPVFENRFSSNTFPDTRSNSGAFTHVTMKDFGRRGPIMRFNVSIGDETIAPVAGYPMNLGLHVPGNVSAVFVQTADIDDEPEHEILAAVSSTNNTSGQDSAYVFAMNIDGSELLSNEFRGPAVIAEEDIISWDGAPLVADITGDGSPEIAIVGNLAESRRVFVYRTVDSDNDGLFDLLHSITVPSTDDIEPIITNGMLVFRGGANPDSLFRVTAMVQGEQFNGDGPASTDHSFAEFPNSALVQYATFGIGGIRNINTLAVQGSGFTIPLEYEELNRLADFNAMTGDFDGDGYYEGAAFADYQLVMYSQNDDPKSGVGIWSASSNLRLRNFPPAMSGGDLDGDGNTDILISDGDELIALNSALASIDHYPARLGARYALTAKVNGDEASSVFAVGDREMSQLQTKAKHADGFPVPLPRDASVVLFPRGSGQATLSIAVGGSDGSLTVYNTPNTLGEDDLLWRSVNADERNSNSVVLPEPFTNQSFSFFPEDRCYNWPNPVYESFTKIRFYVSENADIEIKIYDIAGEKIDELSGKALGGTDNEIEWNVSDIESGVYLAKVKATANGQEGMKIIKVAVIK